MRQPSAALVAEWYAKLPADLATDIDPARVVTGRRKLARPIEPGRMLAMDHLRSIGTASAHADQLGAASYRMPRVPTIADQRGGGGRFLRRPSTRRQRRILRLLADGATVRDVARQVGVSFTVIAAVRRAALQWRDPDDAT
jgi:methyl coenzyme M reductase alpha subunit